MSGTFYEEHKEVLGVDYNYELLGMNDISTYDFRPETSMNINSGDNDKVAKHNTNMSNSGDNHCRYQGVPNQLF